MEGSVARQKHQERPGRARGMAEAHLTLSPPPLHSLPDLAVPDPMLDRALAELAARGALTGARSQKVSARVDPGVLAAAAERLGLAHPSDVINASLALAAAPDRFKAWLRSTTDRLSDDFEPAL